MEPVDPTSAQSDLGNCAVFLETREGIAAHPQGSEADRFVHPATEGWLALEWQAGAAISTDGEDVGHLTRGTDSPRSDPIPHDPPDPVLPVICPASSLEAPLAGRKGKLWKVWDAAVALSFLGDCLINGDHNLQPRITPTAARLNAASSSIARDDQGPMQLRLILVKQRGPE